MLTASFSRFLRRAASTAAALTLSVCLGPDCSGQNVDITNTGVIVSLYPDATNYTFKSGAGNNGQLILLSTSSDSILTGNLTLERNGTVQYNGTEHLTFIGVNPSTMPMTASTVTLGGNNLLLENAGDNSGAGVANVFLGSLSGSGSITAQGSHPEAPERQQAIVHLTGPSLTPSSNVTFNIAGGGLSIDNANALPTTATLNSTYSASLILPVNGTTIGSDFNYHLQGSPDCTNIAGGDPGRLAAWLEAAGGLVERCPWSRGGRPA